MHAAYLFIVSGHFPLKSFRTSNMQPVTFAPSFKHISGSWFPFLHAKYAAGLARASLLQVFVRSEQDARRRSALIFCYWHGLISLYATKLSLLLNETIVFFFPTHLVYFLLRSLYGMYYTIKRVHSSLPEVSLMMLPLFTLFLFSLRRRKRERQRGCFFSVCREGRARFLSFCGKETKRNF